MTWHVLGFTETGTWLLREHNGDTAVDHDSPKRARSPRYSAGHIAESPSYDSNDSPNTSLISGSCSMQHQL